MNILNVIEGTGERQYKSNGKWYDPVLYKEKVLDKNGNTKYPIFRMKERKVSVIISKEFKEIIDKYDDVENAKIFYYTGINYIEDLLEEEKNSGKRVGFPTFLFLVWNGGFFPNHKTTTSGVGGGRFLERMLLMDDYMKKQYFDNLDDYAGNFEVGGKYNILLQADDFGKNHSYLSNGENINYAGEFNFNKKTGELIGFTNRSGHYLPDSSDLDGLQKLKNAYEKRFGLEFNLDFVKKYNN